MPNLILFLARFENAIKNQGESEVGNQRLLIFPCRTFYIYADGFDSGRGQLSRSNAVKVQMPSLEQMPQTCFDQMTKDEEQRVKSLAGNVVGRVPANLCGAFRKIMKKDWLLEDIRCEYNGIMSDSVNPPKYQKFKRNLFGGLDTPGGGVDLKCTYVLIVKKDHLPACISILERGLPREDF